MYNNYYSDALENASQAFKNLFEVTLKEVLTRLGDRKLEKSKDNVALILAELIVEDETGEKDDSYIATFVHVLKQILEYLCIQKSHLFFNNDEKDLAEIRTLLVDKIKEYEEKKLEKRLQKEKRVADFKLKLSGIDFDYLKAFIEKIGLSHFVAFGLLTKLPRLEEKLEEDDISMFTSNVKEMLKNIEENGWKNLEESSPIKNALESLLIIVEELPKLQQLLEKKGIVLNYSDLVDLLKIKRSEIRDENINPLKDHFYDSLKEMTLILLKEAKFKETKEDIAAAFIATVSAIRKNDQVNFDSIVNTFPDLLSEFLNKLLKELNIIQNDLSQDEVKDLLNRKTKEARTDSFEAELKSGAKPTMSFPSNFNTLSGSDFEAFLEKLFKRLGYSVVKTPLTGDQGADLIIEKSGERIVVQAKRYSGLVSNKAIQEVVAAVSYYKCNRAIVVTTSTYTRSALKLAIPNKVELWDSKKLREVINTLKNSIVTDLPKKSFSIRAQTNKEIQKVKTKCIFCGKEIEFSVNLKEIVTKGKTGLKTECPQCENTIIVDVSPKTWKCEYCLEEFKTKEETEDHEKICLKKRNPYDHH